MLRAGWTPLATIAAFKKMVSYTTDLDVIRSALKASDALDLDEQGDNLRRRFVTPDQDPNKDRIVHASGFGVDGGKDAVEKNIGKALERFGSVEDVRALRNLSQDGRLLDGSAFVRFAKKEDAESAVEMSGCVISGRKIGLMPSVDWYRKRRLRYFASPSRHRRDFSPPEKALGGLFSNFEAVSGDTPSQRLSQVHAFGEEKGLHEEEARGEGQAASRAEEGEHSGLRFAV